MTPMFQCTHCGRSSPMPQSSDVREVRCESCGKVSDLADLPSLAPERSTHGGGNAQTTGSTIRGKYDLLERLGQGGYGTVYRARHRLTGTEFALKLLNPGHDRDTGVRQRFIREASVVMKLKSAHTVRVHDIDEDGESLFIVMELLRGETLSSYGQRRGPLPPVEVIDLACQICDALAEAHGLGIVHRDLKPANVMLESGDGSGLVARLLDFGIARLTGDGDPSVASLTGGLYAAARWVQRFSSSSRPCSPEPPPERSARR